MDPKRLPASSPSGFSLVELLIVIGVLALLSGGVYLGVKQVQAGSLDRKVESDLALIASAIERYRDQKKMYPALVTEGEGPRALLCFEEDGSYRHDCQEAAFMQGFATKELLGDTLKDIPLDPVTQTPYVYAVTRDRQRFQIAGLLMAGEPAARVRGGEGGEIQTDGGNSGGLIRAFNGPGFVTNEGTLLPYSPDPSSSAATLVNPKGTVLIDEQKASGGQTLEPGQTLRTAEDGSVTLYLPGGSLTHLDPGTTLTLDEGSRTLQDAQNTPAARVGLRLQKGKIWNKVSRLLGSAEFRVETASAIAGVRGTEFGLEAGGNELILKSGTVAAILKTQQQQNDPDPDPDFLWLTQLSQDKEAVNQTGKYTRFKIPEEEGGMPPGEVIQEEALIKELNARYYAQPFTDRILPLILGINADPEQEGQDVLVFSLAEGTKKIHAVNKDNADEILHTWQGNDIVFDWQEMTMTVDPAPVYGMDPVKFRFEDTEGNMTPAPDPALGLGEGMVLSQSQLYRGIGMLSEAPKKLQAQNAQLPQQPPVITDFLPNMTLSEPATLLSATGDCNWSLSPASSGTFIGNLNGFKSIHYKPLNDDLEPGALQANAASRFLSSGTEQVTIRCTNPNNLAQFDEKVITISYTPHKSSNLSNYQYSHKAQANVSWNIAKTACDTLTEGGYNDWKLPEKVVYENLDIAQEKLNLCEFNGQSCDDLAGVNIFHLNESQGPNGWIFKILTNDLQTIAKNPSAAFLGYRCVRES